MGMAKRVFLIIGVAVAIALAFWYSSALQNSFYVLAEWFGELVVAHEFFAVLLFVLLSALAALVSPFTNVPLIPFAVVIWGTGPTAILLLGGWMLGDMLAYFIGRDIGYPAVRYMVSAERFDRWVETVRSHAHFAMALLLRMALPAELGYAFGIIRYPIGLYGLVTFLAELPMALAAVYASEAILAGKQSMFFLVIGSLVVLIVGAAYLMKRHNHIYDHDH